MKLTAITVPAVALAAVIAIPAAAQASQFPACRPSQLHVTLGHERAALGNVRYVITATDQGTACVLPGYPVLGLQDAAHGHLRSVTTDSRVTFFGPGPAPSSLLVLHGLKATASVSFGTGGGAYASYLTVNGKAVPLGARVSGRRLTATAWTSGSSK